MMHVVELPTVKGHSVWPLATLTSTRPAHQVQSQTNQAMVCGGQTAEVDTKIPTRVQIFNVSGLGAQGQRFRMQSIAFARCVGLVSQCNIEFNPTKISQGRADKDPPSRIGMANDVVRAFADTTTAAGLGVCHN